MFLLNKCPYIILYIPSMISRTSLCCFWVAKFRQLNLQYVYTICTSTFYRRATRFSIARLKLYYRPLDDGNDTRFAQGVMTCDGILHSQKLWVYLSAAAVHSSRGLCKICSENKWTRVESLALSHSSRVTQFESLMLSYLSPRVY